VRRAGVSSSSAGSAFIGPNSVRQRLLLALQSVVQLAILWIEFAVPSMKILFAIAVVSFAALVWAALAIARHVRKNSARSAGQPAVDAEMSEAMDLRLLEVSRPKGAPADPADPSDPSDPSDPRDPADLADLADPHREADANESRQDFSYFNRDAPSGTSDPKPPLHGLPPSKAVVVDRR
jgi:hypothetical protein